MNELGCVIANGLTNDCGTLYTLTIDNCFAGTDLALTLKAHPLMQMVMNLHPSSIDAPVAKIGVDRLPRWEIAR